MSASKKIKHFIQEQHEFDAEIEEVARTYHIPTIFVRLDSLFCKFVYGAPVSQYVGFGMYKMNRHERNCYITDARTLKISKKLNHLPCEEINTILNKQIFNRVYHKFVKRDWLYAPDASDEEIQSLLLRHKQLIIKPSNLTKGEGIHIIKSEEALSNLPSFIESARREKLLLEEIIIQHPILQSINPSSVNTVRLATIREPSGEVHIFGASLRAGGKDSIVDNLHAGGVQYPVDIQTGLISGGGVTFNGKKNILYSPTTNNLMIGLQLPCWNYVLSAVTDAAKIPHQLRYIGWDIAITSDGCELIEANCYQGCNGMQIDGVGKIPVVRQYT